MNFEKNTFETIYCSHTGDYFYICIFPIYVHYIIIVLVGIGCPIRFMTGISCAGCGMTRAWISVGRLDFISAFHYHPLFLLPMIWVIAFLLNAHNRKQIANKLTLITIILFIICYAMRMMWGDGEIVYFHPSSGLIFQILHLINSEGYQI